MNKPSTPPPAGAAPIDTVMFDLGRVLLKVDTEAFLDAFVERFNKPRHLAASVALKEKFLYDWETGRLSQAEVRAYLNENLGLNLAPQELRDWILTHVPGAEELPGMHALVQGLKRAGFRVIGLSNIAPLTLAYVNRLSPAVQALDELYASCELELFKPDPEIYRVVLAAENKRPEQVVFVDDRPENIAAAAQLGLAVVPGEGPDRVIAGLAALGVLPA
ncbi:MAG: HAD family hydrolase [Planctomycetota bacterium]